MRQMRRNCIGVAINCRSHKKSAQLQPTTTTRDNIDGEEKKLKRKKNKLIDMSQFSLTENIL